MKSGNKLIKALWLLPVLLAVPAYFASAALTGQQIYDQNCARCHKLGSYDSSGSRDLLGAGSKVSGKFNGGASKHKGIKLSATDISNIAAFLNNPTTTATLAILTTSFPNATAGTGYSQVLAASGGKTPYTWSRSAGTLPTGLSLDSSGVISGTLSAAGTFTFTVKVTDSAAASDTKSLSITVAPAAAPVSTPMTADDKNLFLANCVACHTPSGLEYRTVSQIQSAITGNVGGMGTTQLKALSSTSLNGIARTLVPGTPEVISCNTCHSSSPPPPPSPTPTTGQAIYDTQCAGCHKLSSYDTSGSAPDLYQSTRIDSYFSPGTSGHKSITLSATDISNLKAFLNAPTSSPPPSPTPTPTPTTGQGVYDTNCASCHRLGTYDTSGTAPNLSGYGSDVSEKYTAGVSGHKGITMTATEISNLSTFLNAN